MSDNTFTDKASETLRVEFPGKEFIDTQASQVSIGGISTEILESYMQGSNSLSDQVDWARDLPPGGEIQEQEYTYLAGQSTRHRAETVSYRTTEFCPPGTGHRVLSNTRYRAPGAGNPSQDAGHRVLTNTRYRAPGTGNPSLDTGYPVDGSGYPVHGTGYRAPGTGHPSQDTGYPVDGSGYPVHGTGYRAPGLNRAPGITEYPVPGTGYYRIPGAGHRADFVSYLATKF